MQKSTISVIPDVRIGWQKRGFSVFGKVSNKSKKDSPQSDKYSKKSPKFLKDSIINANNQREDLTKAIKKVNSKIYFTNVIRVLCLISLIYFLKPLNRRIKNRLKNLNTQKTKFIEGKNESVVNLDFELSEKVSKKYLLMIKRFKQLSDSACSWNIKSKTEYQTARYRSYASKEYDLSKTNVALRTFPGINSSFQSCYFENKSGPDIYLYPCFALISKSKNNFEIIDIRKLVIRWEDVEFVEDGLQPKDANVVKYVWEKSNRDGTRDHRYAENKQIPVMRYGQFKFLKSDEHVGEFMFSNYESTSNFFDIFITVTDDNFRG